MNKNVFWNELTEENKEKVFEVLKNYSGSEGIDGRIFELFEEGAELAGYTVEEYAELITPNEYVEIRYEAL